jgi:hypothetical protein
MLEPFDRLLAARSLMDRSSTEANARRRRLDIADGSPIGDIEGLRK